MADPRLVAVILKVSDLDSSVALYRDAFGLDLHPGNNAVDAGGRAGAMPRFPGLRVPTLTSPSIPPRSSRLPAYRSACPSTTSKQLMQRRSAQAFASFTSLWTSPGVGAVDHEPAKERHRVDPARISDPHLLLCLRRDWAWPKGTRKDS